MLHFTLERPHGHDFSFKTKTVMAELVLLYIILYSTWLQYYALDDSGCKE